MAKVLVALSGGVDSAVAAARLVAAGHDVTGVHLKLADIPTSEQVPGQGCCTLDDASDARRTANVLGIAFYVWDFAETFLDEVQSPFATAYAAGTTPNPCVSCNERVKYAALLERATRLGFDALATGHHVRLRCADGATEVTSPTDGARLYRAADPDKDQTYVLYMASASQLARSLFPVGETSKEQVRAEAADLGLRVANKPESYDVCFIPDNDTVGYLRERLPTVTGVIRHADGRELGTHDGVWQFTVGQRRGLGLDHHERLFVVDIDARANEVVVGPRSLLECSWLEVGQVSWTTGPPPQGALGVQLRAHGREHPARVTATGPRTARITFEEPVHGVAIGQAAVVYQGQECLGGGRIVAADRSRARARLPVGSGVTPRQ